MSNIIESNRRQSEFYRARENEPWFDIDDDQLEYELAINIIEDNLKDVELIPNYYLKDHHEKFEEIRKRINILIERAK